MCICDRDDGRGCHIAKIYGSATALLCFLYTPFSYFAMFETTISADNACHVDPCRLLLAVVLLLIVNVLLRHSGEGNEVNYITFQWHTAVVS